MAPTTRKGGKSEPKKSREEERVGPVKYPTPLLSRGKSPSRMKSRKNPGADTGRDAKGGDTAGRAVGLEEAPDVLAGGSNSSTAADTEADARLEQAIMSFYRKLKPDINSHFEWMNRLIEKQKEEINDRFKKKKEKINDQLKK